jgi:hypothetical protein
MLPELVKHVFRLFILFLNVFLFFLFKRFILFRLISIKSGLNRLIDRLAILLSIKNIQKFKIARVDPDLKKLIKRGFFAIFAIVSPTLSEPDIIQSYVFACNQKLAKSRYK